MPFSLTTKILNAYYPPEEFYIVIVYAPLGYGKSTYQFKVSVEVLKWVYKLGEEQAWEKLKQLIVFHPSQFFQKIEEIERSGLKRVPFLNWDDAGLWLYAMDWRDPFIESFIKYLNVARTHLGALICSSPSPEWIIRKLRRFPSAITVKIRRCKGDQDHAQKWTWIRDAAGYTHWLHPDLKHSGVRTIFVDRFYCKMPDDFYSWYKPLRDAYENLALNLMKERWRQVSDKSKALLLSDYPGLKIPSLGTFEPER